MGTLRPPERVSREADSGREFESSTRPKVTTWKKVASLILPSKSPTLASEDLYHASKPPRNKKPNPQCASNAVSRKLAIYLCCYALIAGTIALLGWVTNSPRLTDWINSGISIFPNTAVAAILLSLAVFFGLKETPSARVASRAFGTVVALIGAATLLEHISGLDVGIDTILINPHWGQRAAVVLGRMGPPASLCFLLLGTVLWLLTKRSSAHRSAPVLCIAALVIGLLGAIGYLFKADPLFSTAKLTGTALPTATILMALSVALLARAPDLEPVRTLLQQTAAGALARRCLGLAVLVPVALGWLFVIGRNLNWFDNGMGAAFLVLALVGLLSGLLWWCVKDVDRHEVASEMSRQRLETLLSTLPAAVYACDAQGRITFYNLRAAKFWGGEPKLNDSDERFCAACKCWFGDKLVEPEQTPMATAVKNGRSFRGLEAVFELPDGTKVPVVINVDPIFDLEGKPAGAITVFQDISSLKQAQAEVRIRGEQLQAIVDNTPECVKIVAADGTLRMMNRSGLCMIEAAGTADVVGKSVYDLIASEHRQTFRSMNERVCGGNGERLEFDIVTLNGARRHMETTAVPVRDPLTGGSAQLAVTRDITDRKKVEESLRQSEERFRLATFSEAITLYEQDSQLRYTWLYPPHPEHRQALGRSDIELLGNEEGATLAKCKSEVLKTGASQRQEVRATLPDGVRYYQLFISPRRNEAGEITGVAGAALDITERKIAEDAVRASRREMELELADTKLLQKTSATLIHENDVEALYKRIVGAAVTIMRSDMASMQIVDEKENGLRMLAWHGFPPEFGEVLKLNRPETKTSCSIARRTGKRVVVPDIESWEFLAGSPELEGHRQAGIRGVQSTPLLSRDGTVVGMISTHWRQAHQPSERELRLLDILARQAADLLERREAEESIARLAAIVEFSDDAIITKNLDGVITTWNKGAERLFGYTAEETIGKPVSMLIPHDRQEEEPDILRRLRLGQPIRPYETVRQRKDGSLLNISLTVSPLKDHSGGIMGASKIARDITELCRTREELAKSHQELEQRVAERTASLSQALAQLEEFSYTVSHDLRAPIRAMQGYAKAVFDDYGHLLDSQGHDYLDRIIRSGTRMDRLVRDILTYSRVARAEIAIEPVELNKLISDIVSHYPEMQEPQARIEITGTLGTVLAHEPSLAQAISNLLSNAVKFVARGVKPNIRIHSESILARDFDTTEVESPRSFIRFSIQDNGIGIRPEHQGRLFGLFERIHPDKKYEGTGIGLAVVRKAVERMGGRVGLHSNGDGGSTFWLELPNVAQL
jgi:PAS domain S-box-containing protein